MFRRSANPELCCDFSRDLEETATLGPLSVLSYLLKSQCSWLAMLENEKLTL
jgi:hypothetical protein